MNHCRTCMHWGPARESTLAKHLGMGRCNCSELSEDDPWATTASVKTMLIYDYAEGGGFNTGPEFGCVHHQEDK